MTTATPDGRRGNGLFAPAYAPLADLDPRVANAVLEALRGAGVAAYAVPSAGQLGGYLEVHPPVAPRDRVWVDAALTSQARLILADELCGFEPEPAYDQAFRSIVAGLQFNVEELEPPAVVDEEHFVPPPPPPLPRLHPVTVAAWAALAVGLFVLVVPTVFGAPVGTGVAVLALVGIGSGAVTLVARMGDRPAGDDGPDDGAVV
jgi:hypothetical protein